MMDRLIGLRSVLFGSDRAEAVFYTQPPAGPVEVPAIRYEDPAEAGLAPSNRARRLVRFEIRQSDLSCKPGSADSLTDGGGTVWRVKGDVETDGQVGVWRFTAERAPDA